MATTLPVPNLRIRHSIQELATDPELRPDLDKVIKAFAGIQALPPNDPNSFYFLGGFHGEPFRGPVAQYPGTYLDDDKKKNVAQKLWWGGYCNHGNVLFPTWHRAYMHRFEKALQSIKGCEDVMLPFWDECLGYGEWNPYESSSKAGGKAPQVIPSILTDEYITIDGKTGQKNPLFSYSLQRDTSFSTKDETENSRFSKPKDYNTCRFPKRGVVFNKAETQRSEEWNAKFKTQAESNDILNTNVAQWLEGNIKIPDEKDPATGKITRVPLPRDQVSVYARFKTCLDAPNYTIFSNTTSQGQAIDDITVDEVLTPEERQKRMEARANIVSLESPHNSMHLAIGGFFNMGQYNANPKEYLLASGDMGDNETASFDPIFFFHHAFIDYVFWCWQRKHGLTKRGSLDVLDDYPGTITDAGSPVGLAPGSLLDMDTPLYPFRNTNKQWVTSNDVTDITELGYEYGEGSLDPFVGPEPTGFANFEDRASEDGIQIDTNIVDFKRTSGINRAEIQGSFVIRTIAKYGDRSIEVGREAVLSRLNVQGCKNCQTHLEAQSLFPVYESIVTALKAPNKDAIEYQVLIDTRSNTWRVPDITKQKSLNHSHGLFSIDPSDRSLENAKSIVHVESF